MDFLIEFLKVFGFILSLFCIVILGLVLLSVTQSFGPVVAGLVLCAYLAFCVTLLAWMVS
jgi:hypothetical protein